MGLKFDTAAFATETDIVIYADGPGTPLFTLTGILGNTADVISSHNPTDGQSDYVSGAPIKIQTIWMTIPMVMAY